MRKRCRPLLENLVQLGGPKLSNHAPKFWFDHKGSKNKVFNFVSFLVSRIRLDERIPNLVSEFGAFVPAFGLNKLDKNSITELAISSRTILALSIHEFKKLCSFEHP